MALQKGVLAQKEHGEVGSIFLDDCEFLQYEDSPMKFDDNGGFQELDSEEVCGHIPTLPVMKLAHSVEFESKLVKSDALVVNQVKIEDELVDESSYEIVDPDDTQKDAEGSNVSPVGDFLASSKRFASASLGLVSVTLKALAVAIEGSVVLAKALVTGCRFAVTCADVAVVTASVGISCLEKVSSPVLESAVKGKSRSENA